MLCVVNIPISGHKINTTLTIVIITSYSSSHGGPSSTDTIPPPPHLNTSSSSCAHFLFQHEPKEIPQAEGFTVHLVICYTLMAPTKVIHLGPSLANIIHRLGAGEEEKQRWFVHCGHYIILFNPILLKGSFRRTTKNLQLHIISASSLFITIDAFSTRLLFRGRPPDSSRINSLKLFSFLALLYT